MSAVRVARVHDPVGARPGRRFLVDLRRWFGHDAEREGDVVLLHAARDTEHDHAVVLREPRLATLGDG